MKKWAIIITSLIAVCIITFCVTVYNVARQPLHSEIERGEAKAKEEFQLQTIENSYIYNGTESYTVVIGKTADEESVISFIPASAEGEAQTRKIQDGISKEEVYSMLQEDDNPAKIMSASIGYESVGPVWEIVYLDEENTLNYYYVSFDDGEWWRTIRNL